MKIIACIIFVTGKLHFHMYIYIFCNFLMLFHFYFRNILDWESQQLLLKPVPNSGDFRPGTPCGSIRREVVCGLPVNPKQKKTKWRQRHNLPSICPGVISAGALSAGTKYGKVLGVNAPIEIIDLFFKGDLQGSIKYLSIYLSIHLSI